MYWINNDFLIRNQVRHYSRSSVWYVNKHAGYTFRGTRGCLWLSLYWPSPIVFDGLRLFSWEIQSNLWHLCFSLLTQTYSQQQRMYKQALCAALQTLVTVSTLTQRGLWSWSWSFGRTRCVWNRFGLQLGTPSAINLSLYQEYYWLYVFGRFKIETLISNELDKKMFKNKYAPETKKKYDNVETWVAIILLIISVL